MLCFGISEQEIESALSSTKAAFCTNTTVGDKPANLEQCVKTLKIAVDTLARIRKDGKRALNKDDNIDLRKEIVDAYKELTRLQGYSGPDKAQKCFEFAGKWRGVVNIPEPIQPQPQTQPPVHESRRSVDSASVSSGGTHHIPDQFYQADMASGSVEIDIHYEENSAGNTPGSRKVVLDVFLMKELNDDPCDESLSHLTNPGGQHEKHTGCFADAAPRMTHSKEIKMNQSEQSEDDEPVENKEDRPVDQPEDEFIEDKEDQPVDQDDEPVEPANQPEDDEFIEDKEDQSVNQPKDDQPVGQPEDDELIDDKEYQPVNQPEDGEPFEDKEDQPVDQLKDDEPIEDKENRPVDQPASETPMKEPAALNQTEVPRLPAKYRVGKVLSQGAISIVREAMHVNTGQRFAAKVFSKRALGGRAAMLKEEIAMMRRVHHPNCISLVDWFETENSVYLIMELAEGGDLSDRLSRKVFEWEGEAARLVREILLGVEYLHSIGIVHGDLRLENVLLLDTFEDSQLRITGFRGDRYLTDEEHEALVFHGSNAAPEVIQQTGHGKPADMWSVGVIAYMLLCGYEPFPNDGRVTHIDSILSGTYEYQEEYWKGISEQAKSFIDALLIPSAEKRLTATQALAHPWFSATLGQGPATSIHLLPKVNSMNMEALRSALRAARDAQRTQEHDGGGIRDGAALPSSEAGGPDSTAAQAVGTVDEA